MDKNTKLDYLGARPLTRCDARAFMGALRADIRPNEALIKAAEEWRLSRLDEETKQFVIKRDLTDGAAWLLSNAPHFFEGCDFEIYLIPVEDGENNLLALKVYGAFSSSEFRTRMHLICEAMLANNHKTLHEVISIFQRVDDR